MPTSWHSHILPLVPRNSSNRNLGDDSSQLVGIVMIGVGDRDGEGEGDGGVDAGVGDGAGGDGEGDGLGSTGVDPDTRSAHRKVDQGSVRSL